MRVSGDQEAHLDFHTPKCAFPIAFGMCGLHSSALSFETFLNDLQMFDPWWSAPLGFGNVIPSLAAPKNYLPKTLQPSRTWQLQESRGLCSMA